MGNESSTEKEHPNLSKPKRAGGLRRSNSLKDNQTKQVTTSPLKEKTSQLQSKGGLIKRSHTFSPSSMKRPTFLKFDNTSKINKPPRSINKNDKDVDNIDLNGNKSLSSIHGKPNENIPTFNTTANINSITEEKLSVENKAQMDSGDLKNAEKTKEEEIITVNQANVPIGKKTLIKSGTIIESEADEKLFRAATIDEEVKTSESCEIKIITAESSESTDLQVPIDKDNIDNEFGEDRKGEIDSVDMLPTVNKYLDISSDEVLRSVDDNEQTQSKSDNEKEMTKIAKKNNRPPDLSLDEKKRTITRRKNRYVRRSQSMKSYHELLPKLLSDDGFASISEISKAIEEKEMEAGLAYKQKLNRRISDTCLIKEEHVRRSEQFTQMLNDLREKARRDLRPLSPYAKEFISEKTSKESGIQSPERKFKFEKRQGYFDFWLKDHNQRIDSLTKALEGNMKIQSLKETFNERCLTVPSKLLLPERPHSVKLPRRQAKIAEFRIASDSSDNEQNSSSVESFPTNSKEELHHPKESEERDTKIKIRSHKRSSMISIRSSEKLVDNGPKSEIRFHTGTLRCRSKIAVVKPLQLIDTDLNNNELPEFVK